MKVRKSAHNYTKWKKVWMAGWLDWYREQYWNQFTQIGRLQNELKETENKVEVGSMRDKSE